MASLRDEGVEDIVVVENDPAVTPGAARLGVRVVEPGLNVGYGRGVNRGAALVAATYLIVSNPDVVVHSGAIAELCRVLDEDSTTGIVGPLIRRSDGTVYPSQRVFPSVWLAGAHALLAPVWPTNPATRRYRSPRPDGTVDWVSGAFFIVRREAFEQVGGFDERYFMFAEDMALCWSLREAGWRVRAVDSAEVTHVEGVSRASVGRRMVVAHHVSAFRFEAQTSRGWRRAFLPVAALVLSLRLVAVLARGS
ncbi:MAG: hypothetical protein B7W95_00860 [Acidimicrobiales bacterium 20-64-4]|nr:MAG: hypothetical protein B7W95_00860 [Acidimicrobiales bacterium 20-64-4]